MQRIRNKELSHLDKEQLFKNSYTNVCRSFIYNNKTLEIIKISFDRECLNCGISIPWNATKQ